MDAFFGLEREVATRGLHRVRREKLEELDRAAGTSLVRLHDDIAEELHGECFYQGRCRIDRLDHGIQTVAEFPERLKSAQRHAERRGR